MRLEKIRLSGFKSFVDPTTVAFPGNLTGIVGPNGCGKSNIIDAIRWVMGESSAKHLRGGAMTDVIFNGSGGRKPVAMAFVELVFDNSDGTVGGEYAKYSSLAIKRQLNRDGQSLYFLNGTRCRRKDIIDIFLGTGLGPRSYAVIEQGTISRLIEAKPEEMRVFIEEAAGISKYKERRHETELRMRHTRENLERLIDLKDEVEKQVGHLRRQAEKAQKFKQLRDQERLLQKQLLAMRWQDYDSEFQRYQELIDKAVEAVNQTMRDKHELDKNIESARSAYKQTQTAMNEEQAAFYEASSQVTQTRQAITHAENAEQSMYRELQQLQQLQQQTSQESESDASQLQQIHSDREQFQSELDDGLEALEHNTEQHNSAQQVLSDWNQQWETVRETISDLQSRHAICQHTIEQCQTSLHQHQERKDKLELELQTAQANDVSELIEQLAEECAELEQQQQELQLHIQTLTEQVQNLRTQIADQHAARHDCQQQLQQTQGKISSLETLQHHASGKDQSTILDWLKSLGLENAPRLVTEIDVENGWETAVETVLGNTLDAVCVDDCQSIRAQLPESVVEALAFVEPAPHRTKAGLSHQHELQPISTRLNSEWAIHSALDHVFCVENADSGSVVLADLDHHQSLITKDGVWFGKGWLFQAGTGSPSSGVLKREKELRELRKTQEQLSTQADDIDALIESLEQQLKHTESQTSDIRNQEQSLSAELLDKTTQLASQQSRQEQITQRVSQLQAEIAEISAQLEELTDNQQEQSETLQQLAEELETRQFQYAELQDNRDQVAERASEAAQAYQDAQHAVRELQSKLQTLDSTEHIALSQMQRSQRQQEQSSQRIVEIQTSLNESVEPLQHLKAELIRYQDLNTEHEEKLKIIRDELEQLEQNVSELSAQRNGLEQKGTYSREKLEQTRIDQQACQVRRQTVIEQLQELNEEVAAVLTDVPEHASIDTWQTELNQLKTRIDRLGTVNLAAIDEVEEQSERLDFLNNQYNDLMDSLNSLEQAIDKIDNESKARFRETFDNINQGLKDKFPRLFGGGRAELELSDNDLLSAGVKIMAQPPGKRNASIHLLSGGEKALTAVALVFSIFELNPAPFCLLDEVDAPLDDANVGRFGAMLEEMSKAVQFIAISHNKATMEICRQLIGVTMKEAGVSRIVAVDLDDAIEMAVG